MKREDLISRPHPDTCETTRVRVAILYEGSDGIVWAVCLESECGWHAEHTGTSRAAAIRKAAELAIAWECPLIVPAQAYRKVIDDEVDEDKVAALRVRGRPIDGGANEF